MGGRGSADGGGSGGKDSCFNALQCVANGHALAAAASLHADGAEPDSFMYQTAGAADAVPRIAACLALPLFRRAIRGAAVDTRLDYRPCAADEVEDMAALLRDVLDAIPDISGVAVGAILSNYQRIRVEHVCARLGLTPLSYLWQADQSSLLQCMIDCRMNSVLVKVAALGLNKSHLGLSIATMQPHLENLNARFGSHICGEGGEYETITLDCPLFKKRLVIAESSTVLHSNDGVAYLKFTRLEVEDKPESEIGLTDEMRERLLAFGSANYITRAQVEELLLKCVTDSESGDRILVDAADDLNASPARTPPSIGFADGFLAIGGVCASVAAESVQEETKNAMGQISEILHAHGMAWSDVVMMQLFVADMADFGAVNAVYGSYFGSNPPTRVTVQAAFRAGDLQKIQIDCLAFKNAAESDRGTIQRSAMHVQGISYWAPANIGPYSQTVKLGDHLFISGQIGLVPNTMAVPQISTPPVLPQDAAKQLLAESCVCFNNLSAIAAAQGCAFPADVGALVCFVQRTGDLPTARAWCREKMADFDAIPALFVAVPGLPRGCAVEYQATLHSRADAEAAGADQDAVGAGLAAAADARRRAVRAGAADVHVQAYARGAFRAVHATAAPAAAAAGGAGGTARVARADAVAGAAAAVQAVLDGFAHAAPVAVRVYYCADMPRAWMEAAVAERLGGTGVGVSYVPVDAVWSCVEGRGRGAFVGVQGAYAVQR